jgi:hypothetical protein
MFSNYSVMIVSRQVGREGGPKWFISFVFLLSEAFTLLRPCLAAIGRLPAGPAR